MHPASAWEPAPDPADLAAPVARDLPGGYIELRSDANRYWAVLPSDPETYRLVAEVIAGELAFTIKTPRGGRPGVGTGLFGLMWAKLGGRANSIHSSWVTRDPAIPGQALDTNLKQFNAAYQKYRAAGMGVMDAQRAAAVDTWTGKRAKNLGFTKITIPVALGSDGDWNTVEVVFSSRGISA